MMHTSKCNQRPSPWASNRRTKAYREPNSMGVLKLWGEIAKIEEKPSENRLTVRDMRRRPVDPSESTCRLKGH